ncbi:MAG: class I SAM-dependent methyltransferase [Patescibacteria group bacterium]|nr:class I SAM-dependent methyltransferase [Patescibacteria group bacterium]
MKEYKEQVKEAYDAIAETFSHTRNKPWYDMASFKDVIKEGEVLDLGCGNGRLYDVFVNNPKIKFTGIDFSPKLIDLALERYKGIKGKNAPKFIVADITDSKIFEVNKKYDAIVLFASYHHILNKKERMDLLARISDHLKDDGIVIVTVWNLWNSKTMKKVAGSWGRKILRKENGGVFDINYPFNDRGIIAYRPYKMFTVGWIKRELGKYFQITKQEVWKKGQNLVFYMKKPLAEKS